MSNNCKICGSECKSETKHAFHAHHISSDKYYDKFYKKDGEGVCKICNKSTRFKSFTVGYCKYCSNTCANNDPEFIAKISNTVKSKECQDKIKNTNIEKYGTEYGFQSENNKSKSKITSLKRYGVDNPQKSKVIRNKTTNTILEKYGVDNYSKTPNFKQQMTEFALETYGCKHHLNSSTIQEKIKKYNMEHYGVEYKFQSDTFRKSAMYKGRYKYKQYTTKFGTKLHYQTKPELKFIEECELKNINIEQGDKIHFYFNGKNRRYFCDFKIKELAGWRLVEVKSKHKWWYEELKNGTAKAKANAAIKYSKENNYLPFKIKFY